MSLRAIFLGMLFALVVAMGGHFNDVYMGQTYMVGNFLPISVIGFLLVIVLVVGPLLWLVRKQWAFSPAELAVIVALPLAACVVPGSGFLRTFTPTMVLPQHYYQMNASWQKNEVLSHVPEDLLAGGGLSEESYLATFLQGMGRRGQSIGLDDIPWEAWVGPLSTWVPFFLVLMIALIGLALVFHRQWTSHEHLVYPIAEFVTQISKREPGHALPSTIRDRLFWYGLVPVLVVHLVNGTHAWIPDFIEIPFKIDIQPLAELLPGLAQGLGGGSLFYSPLFFSVIAFAFFLPSDVTLSLGLATFVGAAFSSVLMVYGVTLSGNWIGPGDVQALLFGAYVGLFGFILFSGRKYYWRVLQGAFGWRGGDRAPEPASIWGSRIFLAGWLGSIFLLIHMGLPWLFAGLLSLLFIIMFVGMSRIAAETGCFFLQPFWQPVGILIGVAGAAALGPDILALTMLACVVISIDPRECMMPFVVNALRIGENAGVPRGRLAGLMTIVLIVGLSAGLVTVLWLQYDRGVGLTDGWAARVVPTMGFRLLDTEIQSLKAQDLMESVQEMEWGSRLKMWRADKGFLTFLLTGLGLFGGCAFLRLRFSKWPLHPVLFLVWFSFPIGMFGASFLLGWIVKSLVVGFGGGSTYQRMKPLMIGIIAGDIIGGLVFMIVGAVYYFVTGFPPARFSIFPG